MLKTTLTALSTNTNSFNNTRNSNNVVNLDGKKVIGVSNSIFNRKIKNLFKTKNIEKSVESKKSAFSKSKINKVSGIDFFTPKPMVAFSQLRKAFTKGLVSCYLDPKYYIQIESDVSGYTISKIPS